MASDIKVSVIVPVYNTEKYLRRCLESLCHQTLTDIEIICVDDCSTDRSLEILREYAAKYPKLRVHAREENGGEAAARNCGLRLAQGEYLGFVDSDDAVDLDFFERLYAQAFATGADVVKGNRRNIAYDGQTTDSSLNNLIRKHKTRFAFAWEFTTAIYRTSIVRDNGIFYLEGCPHSVDILFLNEVMLCSKSLALVDKTFYYYHRRENSEDSPVLTIEKIRSAIDVRERIVDNILSAGDVVDDVGKRFVSTSCFSGVLTYAFRSSDQMSFHYCIDKAFSLYENVSSWLSESDMGSLLAVLPYLQAGDREGLFAFMLKNNTPKKMMFANLRYLQEQRKRQSQKGE